MNRKLTIQQICLVALAIGLNVAGGQIALVLRLPIYLDSIGTIWTGAMLGPLFGMLPSLLSGLIMGMTVDIYSLYFAPAGMLVGLMAGLVWRKPKGRHWILLSSLLVTLPSAIISALICSKLFNGITSSGSMFLVQLLSRTPLGLTASIFAVQIITEYVDRSVSMFLVASFIRVIPAEMKEQWRGGSRYGHTRRTV